MARKRRPSGVEVVGAAAHPLRDAYHLMLETSWPRALGAIGLAFLVANALFALGYVVTGGVANARPGSFADAFFFSVQTMGTVGYGTMVPTTFAANVLSVAECVVGLFVTALSTGLVFARFSRTTAEVIFSQHACISPVDGVPTLAFRIGNDRSNAIFEARVSVVVIRTEVTKEGVTLYRMYDAELVRQTTGSLERSFTVMHRITEKSPLYGIDRAAAEKNEIEIAVNVVGTDDVSLQPVYARHTYQPSDVLWGSRLADVLSERPDGTIVLDVRKFHDTVTV